ncbi:hypothetical protein [Pseudomonas syringae]|uniref:hypothetical protein n=1 Tax=Pseudomonas syringae TaxID=317 RepID=UPI003F75329D
MNISPTSATWVKPQPNVQTSAQRNQSIPSPETQLISGKKEAFAKAFYTQQEAPWLEPHTFIYNEVTEIRPRTKQEYIESTYGWSLIMSRVQSSHFNEFRNELMDLRPDLKSSNFSYTLGDDAELKIIDLDKKLGNDELKYLTDAINQKNDFKESARTHAKIIMALVDHDSDTFKGQYKLDLTNFQDVIDLGMIAASKKNDPREIWINQIKQNAERKEPSCIDIRV